MECSSDSILVSIKKMLGLEDDYTPFDTDVSVHINAAFMTLTQMGVGPKEGFVLGIGDYSKTWNEFLVNPVMLGAVKTYVYLQVKMMFDPPTNSFVMEAMKKQAEEIAWRLNVQAESVEKFDFMEDKASAVSFSAVSATSGQSTGELVGGGWEVSGDL